MTLAEVDFGQLFELVWAALAAGVCVTLAFALMILGFTRADDMRREHRSLAATGYFALALLALAAFFGGVAFGVIVIISK